ncbi:HAD family hydrolase [Winogradskyella sp. A2]|uniref:HAD family hydrolase n=1 Tax=Winogradskyella sp. A2 TaxID=3366944 RepID=UPI00398C5079
MIKTLIFDFGDVFINLDKQGAMENALKLFQLESFENDMLEANLKFETGNINTSQFIEFYKSKFPYLSKKDIVNAWNHILKDFPKYRLEFIKALSNQSSYKLVLLSNTNELHIEHIRQHFNFYEDFKNCFDQFYLSHEIQLRKPEKEIFEFVLTQNNLRPDECLFIDDTKENTDTAKAMGFHIWTIDETKEDITSLFEINKELF